MWGGSPSGPSTAVVDIDVSNGSDWTGCSWVTGFRRKVSVRDSVLQPVRSAISEQRARGQGVCPRAHSYSGSKYGLSLLGRSPGEGKDPLQSSGLENSMDYVVHGVAKSRTGLSDFHFH